LNSEPETCANLWHFAKIRNMTTTSRSAAAKPAARTTARTAARTTATRATATRATEAKPSSAKPAAKPATRAAAKPSAKPAKAVKPVKEAPKPYILLTGIDDAAFCTRVSEKLTLGYELYGSPTSTFNGKNVIVGQALVYKKGKKNHKKK
jgi:hypothetical protein